MSERIEVTISPEGEVEIDAIGFSGKDCLEATKALEAALGAPVERTTKPEMHKSGVKNTVGAKR